jgi:hypothetical protein
MADFRDDDVTPPPIDLSRRRINVEPTMEGLANGIVNTYSELVDLRRTVAQISGAMIARDDCAANRAACPSARRYRPTVETRHRWWVWLDTTAGAVTKIAVLIGMVGSALLWVFGQVAEIRTSQQELKVQIVQELRRGDVARRADDDARDEARKGRQ